MDAVVLINLILCIVIVVLGICEYARNKSQVALYVGIAFGLFGVSHLINLLGQAGNLEFPLITIRLLAYLAVIYALYMTLTKKTDKV